MKNIMDIHRELILRIVDKIIRQPTDVHNPATHKMMLKIVERCLKDDTEISDTPPQRLSFAELVHNDLRLSILHATERTLTEYHLPEQTIRTLFNVLVKNYLLRKKNQTDETPSCICIQPFPVEMSSAQLTEQSQFIDRILYEARQLWSIHLIVLRISDAGNQQAMDTLFEWTEKYDRCCFLLILEGPDLPQSIIEKMRLHANIIVVVTLPGSRNYCEAHLPNGYFDELILNMQRLFQSGIPFGLLMPLHSENIDEIMDESFIHFLFIKQHALFGCLSQALPTASSMDTYRLLTPVQRLKLWQQISHYLSSERLLLLEVCGDNSPGGCRIAGGVQQDGWFVIESNGDVFPCHKIGCSPVNLHQTYENGGCLADIWQEPFFESLRCQMKNEKDKETEGNNCLLRDNYTALCDLVTLHQPQRSADFIDEPSRQALITDMLEGYKCELHEQFKAHPPIHP